MLSKVLFEETFKLERQRHGPKLLSPILLVVDLQNYFTDMESKAYLDGITDVVRNTGRLIEAFKSCELPVALTIHKGGSKIMEEWWGNTVEEGWTVPEFSDLAIFYKDTYDAFHETVLDAFLKSMRVDQLVICGVRTHLCCESTARSAFTKGYATIMVEDALCDKNIDMHVCTLKNLGNGFSMISTTSEVIALLQGYRS